jgi:hypothetical protein
MELKENLPVDNTEWLDIGQWTHEFTHTDINRDKNRKITIRMNSDVPDEIRQVICKGVLNAFVKGYGFSVDVEDIDQKP